MSTKTIRVRVARPIELFVALALGVLLYGTAFAASTRPAPVLVAASTAQNTAPYARQRADLIDINTASVEQLQAIPGLGEVYAKRIVAGRPYYAKNQLVRRGILPQDVYDKVKDKIIAHHIKKQAK